MNVPATKLSLIKCCFSKDSQFLAPTLVFIFGSITSVILFIIVQSIVKSEVQSYFEFSARNRLSSLQTDIVRHQEMVNSVAGLFSSSQYVSREEFHAFVKDALARYPYIQGISWNPLISKSEYSKYVEKAHKEGINNFKITEIDSNGQIISAPVRENYVAVYYIEPYTTNKEALGFNIASHQGRKKAIAQARDTGLAVITEKIKLVQEKEGNYGYLLLKAIYRKGSINNTISQRRKNFTGLAVGIFRFTDWIPLTMRELEPIGIDVWITDESSPKASQLLHFHSSRTRKEVFRPTTNDYELAKKGLHWKTTVNILGRQWSFLFVPSPEFIKEQKSGQAWIILTAGFIITLLLTKYLVSKTHHSVKLAAANKELLNALNEIKALKGIIPICSYCHKIRDDEGAWNQLEAYFRKHSEAEFSHGICPTCLITERKKLEQNI